MDGSGSTPAPRFGASTQKRWTAREITRIRELVADGYTDREIGKEFGRSKGAIREARHRNGIPTNQKPKLDPEIARRRAAVARRDFRQKPRQTFGSALFGTVRMPPTADEQRQQTSELLSRFLPGHGDGQEGRKALLDLGDGDCRYMVGQRFCGLPKERGSYCHQHSARCYRDV